MKKLFKPFAMFNNKNNVDEYFDYDNKLDNKAKYEKAIDIIYSYDLEENIKLKGFAIKTINIGDNFNLIHNKRVYPIKIKDAYNITKNSRSEFSKGDEIDLTISKLDKIVGISNKDIVVIDNKTK